MRGFPLLSNASEVAPATLSLSTVWVVQVKAQAEPPRPTRTITHSANLRCMMKSPFVFRIA
jgi:hypothetical protein